MKPGAVISTTENDFFLILCVFLNRFLMTFSRYVFLGLLLFFLNIAAIHGFALVLPNIVRLSLILAIHSCGI